MALIGSHAPAFPATGASALVSAGGRAARAVAKTLALVAGTGLALLLATLLVGHDGDPAKALPGDAAPEWVDIRRPLPVFDLVATDFARLPRRYEARRRPADGSREDTLTFGDLGTGGPLLRLTFYRPSRDAPPLDSLAADLALAAAAAGLVAVRDGPPNQVPTRFGPVEAADVTLSEGGLETACLGFRSLPDGGGTLRVTGLACGAGGVPVGRGALACVVDKIDLLSAADDPALQRVFVEAERRRGPACLSTVPGPAPREAWLDGGPDLPPLRLVGEGESATGRDGRRPARR